MKKPLTYESRLTKQLERRIFGDAERPLRFADWDYLSEAVHAHNVCHNLALYLMEKFQTGEPLSDDVVCYIVFGVDRDQLINMSCDQEGGEQDG